MYMRTLRRTSRRTCSRWAPFYRGNIKPAPKTSHWLSGVWVQMHLMQHLHLSEAFRLSARWKIRKKYSCPDDAYEIRATIALEKISQQLKSQFGFPMTAASAFWGHQASKWVPQTPVRCHLEAIRHSRIVYMMRQARRWMARSIGYGSSPQRLRHCLSLARAGGRTFWSRFWGRTFMVMLVVMAGKHILISLGAFSVAGLIFCGRRSGLLSTVWRLSRCIWRWNVCMLIWLLVLWAIRLLRCGKRSRRWRRDV